MEQNTYQVKKLNKAKVIIFICIPLIAICIVLVTFAKRENTENVPAISQVVQAADAQNEQTTKNGNDVISVQLPNEEPKSVTEPEPEPKVKVPVYDEQAQEKLSSIYSSTGEKRAFLTFDDGPSSNVTPKILDVLKENNVKATFFVLGSMVEKNPEIAKREYDEGHYIANHGYSHVYSAIYEKPENVLAEYEQCNDIVKAAIGNDKYSSKLFRFPGGYAGGPYASIKKQAAQILADNGIGYVDWNCLTQDSTGSFSATTLMQYLKDTCGNKSSVVILMHDAAAKMTTYEMLQDAINYLKDRGYTFYNFYDIMGEMEV